MPLQISVKNLKSKTKKLAIIVIKKTSIETGQMFTKDISKLHQTICSDLNTT